MKNNNQIFGYVVLVMGIILLLITFSLAVIFLLEPEHWLSRFAILDTGGGGIDNLVRIIQTHFFPLVLLLVMGSTGGRIAKFGIDLVRSPENGMDELLLEKGAR